MKLILSFAPFLVLVAFGILLFIMPSTKKRETSILFGIYFICKAFLDTIFLNSISGSIIELEYIRGFLDNITTLTLYFGFLSLVFPFRRLLRAYLPIIIFIFAISCAYTIILAAYPAEEQEELMKVLWANVTGVDPRFPVIFYVRYTMGYVALALILLFQITILIFGFGFKKFAEDNYSYKEPLKLSFFVYLEIFLLSSILIDVFIIFNHSDSAYVIYVLYSAIFAFGVYYLIANDNVLNDKLFAEQFVAYATQSDSKYFVFHGIDKIKADSAHNAQDDKNDQLRKRLMHYFMEEKPYIYKKLNSNDVAKALNTNRTYVSRVLNKDFNTSFFNFVNVFRIEEAKKLIAESPGFSLKSVADSCGFSSYTTFHKYYKMYKNESFPW